MEQNFPVYNHNIEKIKNRPATASFVLSIISLSFLVLILPSIFIGGILFSMAGQPAEASGVDTENRESMEKYDNESRNLGIAGAVFFFSPPVVSGLTCIPGLIFGLIGIRKQGKQNQARAGIIMSSIPICIGFLFLVFGLLLS